MPVGGEFQVNTYTVDGQGDRAMDISCEADGDFAITWGGRPEPQTGPTSTVYLRRFTSAGVEVGTEFQINTYTPQQSRIAATVCHDASDNLLLVWRRPDGADGDVQGVFAQRFDSTLSPLTSEFLVNSYTVNNQGVPPGDAGGPFPAVASCCLPTGDAVISWASQDQDGQFSGIFAQRIDSTGGKLGTEFMVNTYTLDGQGHPSISCQDNGAFVVVWAGPDPSGGAAILGQRYASSGAPAGTEFLINTFTGSVRDPEVCCDDGGDFVVVWAQNYDSVVGQRFDSAGDAQGSEFMANAVAVSNNSNPDVNCAANGDFIVVWSDLTNIVARQFSADAMPAGSEFQVNTFTIGSTRDGPSICCSEGGSSFAVSWLSGFGNTSGSSGNGRDGEDAGVFAQAFAVPPSATPTATPTSTPTQTPTQTQTQTPTTTPMDQPNGADCTDPSQCASTFCVTGVCCNTACNQAGQSCVNAGSVGTCSTAAAAAPVASSWGLAAGAALLAAVGVLALRRRRLIVLIAALASGLANRLS
jgi:hypothetical protein